MWLPSPPIDQRNTALPSLRDGSLGGVVELLGLVTSDDMPGREDRDPVDRISPRPKAADDHTFPEVQVSAVVDHIPSDNQPQIRDVENAVVLGVAVADLDDHEIVSFEREAVARDRHRCDMRWRDAWVHPGRCSLERRGSFSRAGTWLRLQG